MPFDEGSLTGTLTRTSRWPESDWRNIHFAAPHLAETLERLTPLQRLVDAWGMSLADAALRFILSHPAVSTTIPGMRRVQHVETNLAASDRPRLDPAELDQLRVFRWTRTPDDRP